MNLIWEVLLVKLCFGKIGFCAVRFYVCFLSLKKKKNPECIFLWYSISFILFILMFFLHRKSCICPFAGFLWEQNRIGWHATLWSGVTRAPGRIGYQAERTKQTRHPRETQVQQTPQTSVCSANVIRGQSDEKHFDTCLTFGVRGTGYKQWGLNG